MYLAVVEYSYDNEAFSEAKASVPGASTKLGAWVTEWVHNCSRWASSAIDKYDWWHIARLISWRHSVTNPKLLLPTSVTTSHSTCAKCINMSVGNNSTGQHFISYSCTNGACFMGALVIFVLREKHLHSVSENQLIAVAFTSKQKR